MTETEGNIDSRGSTKHTAFPTLHVLLPWVNLEKGGLQIEATPQPYLHTLYSHILRVFKKDFISNFVSNRLTDQNISFVPLNTLPDHYVNWRVKKTNHT